MKSKKLKKLQLKTEQLISMNDDEMFNLKGGGTTAITTSSYPCIYEGINITIDLTIAGYEYGVNNSIWGCAEPPYTVVIEYGGCKLPTAYVGT